VLSSSLLEISYLRCFIASSSGFFHEISSSQLFLYRLSLSDGLLFMALMSSQAPCVMSESETSYGCYVHSVPKSPSFDLDDMAELHLHIQSKSYFCVNAWHSAVVHRPDDPCRKVRLNHHPTRSWSFKWFLPKQVPKLAVAVVAPTWPTIIRHVPGIN
jgi:hypothetical protein